MSPMKDVPKVLLLQTSLSLDTSISFLFSSFPLILYLYLFCVRWWSAVGSWLRIKSLNYNVPLFFCSLIQGLKMLCKCHHDLNSMGCIFQLLDSLFQLGRAGRPDQYVDLVCVFLNEPVGQIPKSIVLESICCWCFPGSMH